MDNYMVAEECYDKGELSLAKFYYRQAMIEEPDNKQAMMKFLNMCFLLGMREELSKNIQEAKHKFPDEYFPYHLEYYLTIVDNEESVESYLENLNNKFFSCSEYQYDRFVYYAGHKQEMKAISIAENYLVNNPKAYDIIYADLAELYAAIGDYEKAEKIYAKRHISTGDSSYLVKLMEMKIYHKDLEGAKEIAKTLKTDEEMLYKISGMLIEAILEESKDTQNATLEEIIYMCKGMHIEYPARAYTDMLCSLCYFVQGKKEKALEIIDFIESIAGKPVQECNTIKQIINDTDIANQDTIEMDVLIWKKIFEVYMSIIRKA